MHDLDFCNITRQIERFPHEDVKKWGIATVRDMMAYQEHVARCSDCEELMDAIIEAHKDEPQRPDPTSLN